MPTPITNKHEMYRRLSAGLLGHTLPSANTLDGMRDLVRKNPEFKSYLDNNEFEKSMEFVWNRKVWAIRSLKSNSWCHFNITANDARVIALEEGNGNFNFSPMLDDSKRVCYGHLYADSPEWDMLYTEDEKPARLLYSKDGCQQKHRHGLSARLYLQTIMDDKGWQTLTELVELYPDHCIEFSVMATSLAAFGPTNTIIWEVRCLTGEYERDTFHRP